MIFFIVGVFSINYVSDVYACSCIGLTEQEALEKSFASFVGVPIKIEFSSGHNNIVTFQIEKPIKNISADMTEITLTTPTYGPACGYNFENNTRYLVHVREQENQKYLGTSLCSGNKNLGFSSIPLLVNESIVTNYSESVFVHQIILYLMFVGIISGIVIGIIVYNKKKKLKTKQ